MSNYIDVKQQIKKHCEACSLYESADCAEEDRVNCPKIRAELRANHLEEIARGEIL